VGHREWMRPPCDQLFTRAQKITTKAVMGGTGSAHGTRVSPRVGQPTGLGQPTGDAATTAAIAGDTRTTPANSLPMATGTTWTFSPGCGAWIIQPRPR
jgi:hypothetical protein